MLRSGSYFLLRSVCSGSGPRSKNKCDVLSTKNFANKKIKERPKFEENPIIIAGIYFDPKFQSEPLARIIEKHQTRVVQIHCLTEPEVLLERYRNRWERGERHPGHADHITMPEMESLVNQKIPPLELPGPVFELDTTDLANLETSDLFAAIQAELNHE